LPPKPGGITKWYRKIVSEVLKPTNTRHNPTAKRCVPAVRPPVPRTTKELTPIGKRRKGNNNGIEQIHDESSTMPSSSPAGADTTETRVEANPIAQAILNQSWWDTGDAILYFGAIDGEVLPNEAVVEIIAKLQQGYTAAAGWKLVIDDFDQQDSCLPYKIFNFQLKCRYVSLALRYALEEILWERGFIDPEKKKEDYTVDGKTDAFGNVIRETSLKHLMSLLTNFIGKGSLLQDHGRLLGVKVVRSPKCHPKIAGEGIKYDWGCAKGVYRRQPISQNKIKVKFRRSVRTCMDSTGVLTIERHHIFSKRAREYMLAYSILDHNEEMG
jgi:hypothetical protein